MRRVIEKTEVDGKWVELIDLGVMRIVKINDVMVRKGTRSAAIASRDYWTVVAALKVAEQSRAAGLLWEQDSIRRADEIHR